MSATARHLQAALARDPSMRIKAKSYQAPRGHGAVPPGRGIVYSITGGTPWPRRVVASLIRNAHPGAVTIGVRGGMYTFDAHVFVPTKET